MDEKKSLDEMKADNDFAERFFKIIVSAISAFGLLIIIAVLFFWGDPDLADSIPNLIKSIGGNSCQS